MKTLKPLIEKFALANAYLHNGKANAKAVLGKVLAEAPEWRGDIKNIIPYIKETVAQINEFSQEEQEEILNKKYPELLKKLEIPRERAMIALPKAKIGCVVTRMPPEPSKYMLAGHAITFLINYLYAKKYKGKCILRFEDTNTEKSKKVYEDSFMDGTTRFLNIKPDKIVHISDDLPSIYKVAEGMIRNDYAYVCFCPREKMQKLRRAGKPCECRSHTIEVNLKEWNKMLKRKYSAGRATLRLRGKLQSSNQTLRDPVLCRIDYKPHYLQKRKYCVWPTYDLAVVCEDEFYGITHILRSIEFGEERIELQNYLKKLLSFRKQVIIQYGRFNISGLEKSSGRVIRALIQKGAHWDDPQMPTIAALERRGFVKETFYELAKQVGLSKTATTIDEKTLAAINRKFVDPIANRYYFVPNPIRIIIQNMPKIESVRLPLHPDKEIHKVITLTNALYISKKDFIENRGREVRLKGLCNIYIPHHQRAIQTKEVKFTGAPVKQIQKIQWVTVNSIKTKILMPDKSAVTGLAEQNTKRLKVGDIIQFERFGFCRLDKKGLNSLIFVFGHK